MADEEVTKQDIFVSYSRKDQEFVRVVVEELKGRGASSWVDWEDIPPSSNWREEIYAAIEQASTFLFIVSTDSLKSEVCLEELGHAIKHNKRLLPVIYAEPKGVDVPDAISSHNWIFARKTDDFSAAVDKIYQAYVTDLDWVRMHTRVLNRALRWDKAGRNDSILFRGEELREGETWIAEAASGKEPQPTQLQQEFLIASRKQATLAQRRLLIGVSGALLVSIVLGVMAFRQYLRAEDNAVAFMEQRDVAQTQEALAVEEAEARATQQAIAETNERLASARAIALDSINLVDTDPFLSLELAMYSFQELSQDSTVVNESYNALFQNFAPYSFTTMLGRQDSIVEDVVIANERGWAITANRDGEVIFYELASGAELRRWFVSSTTFDTGSVGESAAWALGLSHNEDYLAVADAGGGVDVIDLNTDAVLFHFDVVNDSIEALEFSVDDRSLITVDRQGGVSAWSLDSGEELYRTYPEGEGVWMNSVNVASNGAWMVVGTDNYKVRVLDIDTGENVTVFQNPDIVTWCVDCAHSTFVIAAVFSQNNGTVYSAGWDAVVHAWDLYSGDLLKTYSGHSGEVTDLALSAEDQLMVTSGFDGTVRVWDVANGTEIAVLRGHSGAVNQVAISDSGEYIVTAGQDGTVRLFYDRYRNETLRFPVGEQNYTSYVLADFDASGEYIVYSGWGDPIQLLDTNTAETVAVLEGDIEGVLKVDFSADGRYMVGGTNFNRVYVWDMSDYSLIEELRPLPEDPPAELLIYGVAISPDGRYVVMSEGRSGLFRVWDMLDRKFVFETVLAAELSYDCPDCITQVFDFEFSPDGAYLVVSRADANVQVWQVEGWIRTETNVNFGDTFGYANGVLDSAFSINGSMVASASSAASLKVWDFATGDVRFELEGHVDAVQTVDFTSDGVMIITASEDDTVRFWDADTGKYMFKYDYGGQNLKGAQISPDGQHLMVITQFPVQIYVYDFRLSTLFPLVEQAIGDGALSANDCSLYIQSTDCELDWTLFKLAIGILE